MGMLDLGPIHQRTPKPEHHTFQTKTLNREDINPKSI